MQVILCSRSVEAGIAAVEHEVKTNGLGQIFFSFLSSFHLKYVYYRKIIIPVSHSSFHNYLNRFIITYIHFTLI